MRDLEARLTNANALSDSDLALIRRAFTFSSEKHQGQVRHSGEPYMAHSLAVANTLADRGFDAVTIASALLHDVVEDTLTSPEEVERCFGHEVARIVMGVTKLGSIPFVSLAERDAENKRRMFVALADDIRVLLVKLSDRLHNMRTIRFIEPARQLQVAKETLDIYVPIAGRLGLADIKDELEELSFATLFPDRYTALKPLVVEASLTGSRTLKEVKRTIGLLLEEAGVHFAGIDGRLKSVFSVHLKIQRLGIGFEQLTDLVGVRILTLTIEDCYAALSIVHQRWPPVDGRVRDFVAAPRPNGYQCIHTTVTVDGIPLEIQIRTTEMHHAAEEGAAGHWKYKEGRLDRGLDDEFRSLRRLLRRRAQAGELLSDRNGDLYPTDVFAFTPKGDVQSLPRGASAVDFAYAVDATLGDECSGARINGVLVPLRTQIKTGDIVEILTNAGRKPSIDWLYFAVTSLARQRITEINGLAVAPSDQEAVLTVLQRSARGQGSFGSLPRPLMVRARCCNPIRGEEVVSCRIGSSRDCVVHSARCNSVDSDAVRLGCLGAAWGRSEVPSQRVTLRIGLEGASPGLVTDCQSVVSRNGAVMYEARRASDQLAFLRIIVFDYEHLESSIGALKHVQGVVSVHRSRG